MSRSKTTPHSSDIGGFDAAQAFLPNPYTSLPPFPLEPGTGESAPLPKNGDLFRIANLAWRGTQHKVYEKSRGLLFKGRDLLQYLLYHLRLTDTPEHLQYCVRIANFFLQKRYMQRLSNTGLFHTSHRRKANITTFSSDHRILYDFNQAAVSRLHVVVLVHSAHNILARDRSGTSDPCCVVSLNGEQVKNTAVVGQTCYPEWNEVFTFGVRDVGAQQVVFSVYDYDHGKENDFIGYARLPLHHVLFEARLKQKRLKQSRMLRQQELLEHQSTPLKSHKKKYAKFHRKSVAGFQAQEVVSTFKGTTGMTHNVDMLMGEGAFEGAMFELPLGYGPKHLGSKKRKIGVKGTLRVGCYLREYTRHDLNSTKEDQDSMSGEASDMDQDEEEGEDNQKYTLYCQIYHASGIRTKGLGGHIGNHLPGLHWMNRIKIKCGDHNVYSKYVYKTTGPEFNEVLSMDVEKITSKVIKIRMYEAGQGKLVNRFVGEVGLPLSLIRVVAPQDTAATTGTAPSGNATSSTSDDNNASKQARASTLGMLFKASTTKPIPKKTRVVEPSLRAAIESDELLGSVDTGDIPKPSMMPLLYTWGKDGQNYREKNGEIMMAVWMIPKGGSLFGDINETDVVSCICQVWMCCLCSSCSHYRY